ncbi:glycosyltransferase family 39 protein [Hymenobacter sp. HSC-4F20]|uniref:ArnT family glycosyltransferase n=1 Tax=Hymenobacter sp. HSC-4F20 TaxID=2864135 RepID=UPI001C72E79F|nr:glycosyltransferase family 39 protein [Hymenobacter sp. HSC-4F20]MBX0289639.1 glycosyltransferase family 39 protein [Hymenobacter sp. HSC-4F20]
MRSLRNSSSRWGRVVAVLVVCGVNFFVHSGAPDVSLMESRNFVAAREMVAGGSWLIPTMNGELRLAKPPLPTWAVAALQKLTGPTEDLGLLRLPAALAATLLVLFFWGLARELTRNAPGEQSQPGRTAWWSALVLASCLLVLTSGREGQWDIFANSMMVGSLWLLVRGWGQSGKAWLPFLGAGILAGLSMLSKGPVAVYALLLPFLLAYLIRQPQHRRQVRRQRWGTLAAAVLGVGVGASWPAYIGLHVAPAALRVARTEISSWGDRHVQAPWYYWSFFAFTGLWALVALASLVWPYARVRAGRFIPYAVALGWVVAGLVLLSLVPEKKERYMLPLMPPLALLVAGLLRYWETMRNETSAFSGPDRWVVRGWAGLLLLLFLGVPVAMILTHLPGFGWWSPRFLCGSALFTGLGLWVGWQGVRHARVVGVARATVVGVAAVVAVLMPAYPAWEARKDTPGLRRMRDTRQLPALAAITTWRSLDTLHVKQIWAAGRAIPVWHPTTKELTKLSTPVGVFSASPTGERLPAGWAGHVRLTVLDTFYLGRNRESGYWYVSRLDPI